MQSELLVLGAGITGLTAGGELGSRAIIVEKESRTGGLVRSHCFNNGFWFDHVLHILHFKERETEEYIKKIISPDILKPCTPVAWIETSHGDVLYPFQLNIGALDNETKKRCIEDYAKNYFNPDKLKHTSNYHDFLQSTFGEAMCEIFYYPYNKKLYKFPLENINAAQLTWNLHKPKFEEILEGAFSPDIMRTTYNSNAYYPRPPQNASLRGMEVVTQLLARRLHHAELNFKICSIDLPAKAVYGIQEGKEKKIRFYSECLSTIPLPALIRFCKNVPNGLLKKIDLLEYNIVYSVAISVEGPRPENTGHWRYYTDQNIPFTRLVFMTEFDKDNAPANGWGILAEITHYTKQKKLNRKDLTKKILFCLKELSLINQYHKVIGVNIWIASPAYVIFTDKTQEIISDCFDFLGSYHITSLGRYGNWEYSSMSQNIYSALQWVKKYQ